MVDAVNVPGIRRAAAKLTSDDGGPVVALHNAQELLQLCKLGSNTLSLLGRGTVEAHNHVVDVHLKNLKDGIAKLQETAEKLGIVANSWERSDQPWVVKKEDN
ncbi:hypothetical protein [Longispora urticae]